MSAKGLIRIDRVSSVNPANCSARVTFEDREDVVSYELPVLVRGSQDTKDYWLPTPGEQVLCIFAENGKSTDGFIVGTFFSEADPPPASSSDKRCVVFTDGTKIEYDMSSKTITIECQGPINIKSSAMTITGDTTIDGNLTVAGSITSGGG